MGPRSMIAETMFDSPQSPPPRVVLQWGRDQLTAETRTPPLAVPAIVSRFNGAAINRPRKLDVGRAGRRRHSIASMGPRSFDRGNVTQRRGRSIRSRSFNGAAIIDRGNRMRSAMPGSQRYSLQWGRDQLTAETSTGTCRDARNTMLQWGRDQLTAETHRNGRRQKDNARASMGPRSIDRGNICGGQGELRALARFNGAAIN